MLLCSNCHTPQATFRCGACESVRYCNRQCQLKHWRHHKKECKKLAGNRQNQIALNQIQSENNNEYKRQNEYEAYVLHHYKDKKVWMELNGPFLQFYNLKPQNNKNPMPYDVINILLCDTVTTIKFEESIYPFGIRLYLVEETISLSEAHFNVFSFQTEKQRDLCYEKMDKANAAIGSNIKSNDFNVYFNQQQIIYSGQVLFKHKLFHMMLPADKNILYLFLMYDKATKHSKKLFEIDLNKYTKIYCFMTDENVSLFQYGLKLESNNNESLLLSFKKNNERMEWMTHFEVILNNNSNINIHNKLPENNQKTKIRTTGRSIAHLQSDEVSDILMSGLKIYKHFMNNKQKNTRSLSWILQKKLNVDYIDILNCFHQLDDINLSNQNKYKLKCKKDCEWIERYKQIRNVRKVNINIKRLKEANNDVLLHEIMNQIHCFLYHKQEVNVSSDKFNIITNEKSKITDEINENKNEENDELNEHPTFAFGNRFMYYPGDKHFPIYVEPKYRNLKDELLNNPYCKIDENEYNYLYLKALNIKKSKKFMDIRAKHAGEENMQATVREYDNMCINHIISLLIYCNYDHIQKEFKRHTRRLYDKETTADIITRQSYIAHWTRYLNEATTFFGKELLKNECVYTGMNTKLLFNTFNITNYSPLSTTPCIEVANKFATNSGLILKLQANGAAGIDCYSRYFDMTMLSDFVEERERFFGGCTKFEILDIIVNGSSNENKLLALKLLENMLNGSVIYHKWNKKHIYKVLIQLLDEYIHSKNNNSNKETQDLYFKNVTKSFVDSFINRNYDNDPNGTKLIYINESELNKLKDDELGLVFCSLMEVFISNNLPIHKIRHNKQYKLNEQVLIKLKQTNMSYVSHLIDDFKISHTYASNGFLRFQLEISSQTIQDTDYINISLIWKKSNVYPVGIRILWDIVCKEVKYRQVMEYGKLFATSGYSAGSRVFPAAVIKNLKTLTMHCIIRFS